MNSLNKVQNENEIILINTLDGSLHGMSKKTGRLIWSRQFENSLIKVKSTPHSTSNTPSNTQISNLEKNHKRLLIPEPSKNVNLYTIIDGSLKVIYSFNY